MHSLFLCQLPPNLIRLFPRKVLFIKIAFSFPSLILCLIPPTDNRETTEGTPKEGHMTKKALFLRLSPKKVNLIPEKVVFIPEKVDYFPEKVDIAHQLLKKMHFFAFFLRH